MSILCTSVKPAFALFPIRIVLVLSLFVHSCFSQSFISSEQYFGNLEEQLSIDNNTLLEQLSIFTKHPIDINRSTLVPLTRLGLLTDYQLQQLRLYQSRIGQLLSIYELQAVPSFDLLTIERIRPFVTVRNHRDAIQLSLLDQMRTANHTLYMRAQQIIETKKGFQYTADGTRSYMGSAQKIYLRYFLSYNTALSMGFTAEKDPGESFFKTSNSAGFDFYSFHFFLNQPKAKLERLVIGDFTAQFGQGLLLNTGFSRGKGANITAIKITGPSINRFTSVSESGAFKGIGSSWNITPTQQLTSFISYRKRDGTLRREVIDEEDRFYFSAFQTSGFHRTSKEIEKENTVGQFTTGFQFEQTFKGGSLHLNGLYNAFSIPLIPRVQAYNRYRFTGQQSWNTSIDYQYTFLNYHFFGEVARSSNGTLAMVNGVVSSLLPKLNMAIHWRYLPPSYQALFGQTFTESAGTSNEKGVYIGLAYQPHPHWNWSGYIDFWKHPWLKYLVNAPSKGKEFYTRITFSKRKRIETYLQFKQEYKQRSYRLQDASQKELFTRSKSNIRLHLSYHQSTELEWRSRLEISLFKLIAPIDSSYVLYYDQAWTPLARTNRKGFLLYQDVLYKPLNKSFQVTARLAFFHIDNYDARIYAYENDLLNQFSIPAYFNTGHRIYGNIRYQAKHWLTLETRLSQTYYWDQPSIGSGSEKIDKPRRTEVKVQIRFTF